jgi:hypothetical protein
VANNITVPVQGGTANLATDDKDGLGVHWQRVQMSGEQSPTVTGSLSAVAGTVLVDVNNMGNVSFALYGTHAGFTVIFEGSPDDGTTWFPVQVQREMDGAVLGTDTLAANAGVLYTADCPGVTHFRVRATARTSGTVNVLIIAGGMLAMPVVSIGNTGGATGTTATVTASTTAKTIQAANPGRRGLTIYNDSSSLLYVLLGAGTASTTVFSNRVAANSYYEVPFGFTGIVSGVWTTATGNARVTEVTA